MLKPFIVSALLLVTIGTANAVEITNENTKTKPFIIKIESSITGAEAKEKVNPITTALASWYGMEACADIDNCHTTDGSRFDKNSFSSACSYNFSLGTNFRIHYQGKTIQVVCNDRGAFEKYGRTFDLSRGAFEKLAPTGSGVIKVRWEVI